MTELEKEIFWKLLIDLFLETPTIGRRLKEERAATQSGSDAKTASGRALDFSKNLSVSPLSPYAE
jgi:hypothetical protein